MTLSKTAAWLRLFQSGKTAQARTALKAVGLTESLTDTFWSADSYLDAYDRAAIDHLRTLALDGHGRPVTFARAAAGLVSHGTLTGPRVDSPNVHCRTLILGACFQGTKEYMPAWREAFPNAVIVAAVREVPDGVTDGCALIANLINVSLDNPFAVPDAYVEEIRKLEAKSSAVREAEFWVNPPA
jgi:hypothetical protein